LSLSVDEDRLPFGANFAMRAAEQRALRYDPELGSGWAKSSCVEEETDVIARVLGSGVT